MKVSRRGIVDLRAGNKEASTTGTIRQNMLGHLKFAGSRTSALRRDSIKIITASTCSWVRSNSYQSPSPFGTLPDEAGSLARKDRVPLRRAT